MSIPVLTGVAPRWETEIASALGRSRQVHVARRCADVAELLGVAAAGVGRVAVISADFRGLDRAVLDGLRAQDVQVLGLHPPADEAAARLLRRWGVQVVLPADVPAAALEAGLDSTLALDPRPGASLVPGTAEQSTPEQSTHAGDRDAGVGESPMPDRSDASTGSQRKAPADATPGESPGGALPGEVLPGGGRPGEGPQGEAQAGEALDDPYSGAEPPVDGPEPGAVTVTESPGQVVVVWGPIGSPGRTTVAVNLAAELASPLTPVLLVDADTYGASVGQTLAVLDEAPGLAAAARAADQGTLNREMLSRLAPQVRPGLRVLTGMPRADRWPELREIALADVFELCRSLACWTVIDVAALLEQDEDLTFDTSAPRRNGAALTAIQAADQVVAVGAADPVGLQRLVRGLEELGAQLPPGQVGRSVVVNRVRPGPVGPEPGRRIGEALERFAGVRDPHLIPEDQAALDAALLHGRTLEEVRPRSPARLALVALADAVGDRTPGSHRAARAPARRRTLGLSRLRRAEA